jgi:uncharacterized membrane protein YbhN (UPF0104 family)
MASFKQVMILFAYSVILWVLFSVLTYLFLLAFSIEAPFIVAVTIQVFICLGVALPSAPGFIGHVPRPVAMLYPFRSEAVVAVSLQRSITCSVLCCVWFWELSPT